MISGAVASAVTAVGVEKKRKRRTALYRHYDAHGALLYVGISLNPFSRTRQHRNAPWAELVARIDIEWFPCRDSALDAETVAIQAETPKHNIHKKTPRSKFVTLNEEVMQDALVRVHSFKPIYLPREVAVALDVPMSMVKGLIAKGALRTTTIETLWRGEWRSQEVILGVHVIECLELLADGLAE